MVRFAHFVFRYIPLMHRPASGEDGGDQEQAGREGGTSHSGDPWRPWWRRGRVPFSGTLKMSIGIIHHNSLSWHRRAIHT
jgi:hypothetical protein